MKDLNLIDVDEVIINQIFEAAELLGYSTRNKYQMTNSKGEAIGFAAEQERGVTSTLLSHYTGHKRVSEMNFFDSAGNLAFKVFHPFRWFFNRMEIRNLDGDCFGAIQKKFAIGYRKIEIEDENGKVILQIQSRLWKPWVFIFLEHGNQVAKLEKKWTGLLTEVFTDKDRFNLRIESKSLSLRQRNMLLVAAVFVDLIYFERN